MVTKQDVLLLLADLQDSGIDTKSETMKVLKSKDSVPLDTLEFINKNKELYAYKFYEKIRKSYNDKKSKLYWNIVHEVKEPKDVLTTLGSMNLQILLFMKNVDDTHMFLNHMRFNEIQKVFLAYYSDGNLIPAMKLIELYKADLKVFEMFRKNKQNEI